VANEAAVTACQAMNQEKCEKGCTHADATDETGLYTRPKPRIKTSAEQLCETLVTRIGWNTACHIGVRGYFLVCTLSHIWF
jgi:hypothetical protein